MEKSNNTTKEGMKTLPFIYAVDFDGTLVEDEFPEVGIPTAFLIKVLKHQKLFPKCKWILWTSRDGEALEKAVNACKNWGLRLDAVNENIPEVKALFGGDTRKIYANVYIDDKSTQPENCHIGYPGA